MKLYVPKDVKLRGVVGHNEIVPLNMNKNELIDFIHKALLKEETRIDRKNHWEE